MITGQKELMVETEVSFSTLLSQKFSCQLVLQEAYLKFSLLLQCYLFIYSTTFCGNPNDVLGNRGWETLS
jgi:hypothetical protein